MNYRKGVKGWKASPLQGGVKLKKEDYFPLMSSSGQFLGNGGRGPTSPAIPEEDPRRECGAPSSAHKGA